MILNYILWKFFLVALSSAVNVPSLKLSSGYHMPLIGIGTARIYNNAPAIGSVTYRKNLRAEDDVMINALKTGYRHIDTALLYGTEENIGVSLKKWFAMGNKREDIFITTKLPPYGNRPGDVEKYLKNSLKNLGIEYVDMYLIHQPWTFLRKENSLEPIVNEHGDVQLDMNTDHIAVWKEMEKQVKLGRVRSIGVSNFNESQILNILKHSEIQPSNLQIELHEYFQQKPMQKFCAQHNISLTAYSPLGTPALRTGFNPNLTEEVFPDPLKHPLIRKIGLKYGKTNAQVMLRHLVQKGIIVVPKSKSPKRQKENIDIFDFELTEEDVEVLDGLDKGKKGRIFTFRDEYKGVQKHPEYPYTDEVPS